jgi:sRNA-binding protein
MTSPPEPPQASPPQSDEACADLLRQHFPALFGGAPKPLKLRIQADIQARVPGVFTRSALSAFLRRHTGRNAYLLALTRAVQRFDLDGAPSGEISAEHRQAAVDELARRRELRNARIANEDEQRRNRAELLRAFQATTLTEANFCALKGLGIEELHGILSIARAEADAPPRVAPHRPQRPQQPQRPARRRGA